MDALQDIMSYSTSKKKNILHKRINNNKTNPMKLSNNQFRERIQNKQKQLATSLSMFQKNKTTNSNKKDSPKLEMSGPSSGMVSRWDRIAIRSSSSSVSRHQFNNMAVSPIQRTQARSPLKMTLQNQSAKKVDSRALSAFQARSGNKPSSSMMSQVMSSKSNRPTEQHKHVA